MKVGDYYYHKFNKYVERITKITPKEIELKNIDMITTVIKSEYFNDNYMKCNPIYNYVETIVRAFKKAKFKFDQSYIRVDPDPDNFIAFGIVNNQLRVVMSEEVYTALELEDSIEDFLLDDAEEVINMIADLFEED